MLKRKDIRDTRFIHGTLIRVWYVIRKKGSIQIYVGAEDYNKISKRFIDKYFQWHRVLLKTVGYTNETLSPINSSKTAYFQARDHEGARVCGLMTKFTYAQ